MSWEKDSLLAKAKTMFAKASNEDRDDIFFGLFNSIGLELLERAALAKISPTLLADHDDLHRHTLYALGHEGGAPSPKSIITARVIEICANVVPGFKEMSKFASSMANRRNEEAHSGAMAFVEYGTDTWVVQFYKTCKILADFLEISLEDLFVADVSKEAAEMLSEDAENIKKKVNDKIARRKAVFKDDNPEGISEELKDSNCKKVDAKTHIGYHKVNCPVCNEAAVITGFEAGSGHISHEDGLIVERSNVTANQFECEVCKLKLSGTAELQAASLPLHFTRTVKYTPEEFYGWDEDAIYEERREAEMEGRWEYNNE